MTDVVQKLWGFCHTLRHDGIDYGDYIEQITYLLFLKMADERGIDVPEGLRLADLRDKSGTDADSTTTSTSCARSASSRASSATSSRGATVALQQPGQPQEADRPDRRDRVDRARRRRQGRGLRGPAGEGRERGQEGRGPVLHAAPAHPVHRPLHEARPARAAGLHDLRPGLRHRRLPRRRLRVAHGRDQGRRLDRDTAKRVRSADLLRPGARRPAAPAGADEPLPPRRRAAHRARRHDLRAAERPSAST